MRVHTKMACLDFCRVEPMAEDRSPEKRVIIELERRLREREVRVPERMVILDKLASEAGEVALCRQMIELQERLESTARTVREALS